VVHDDLRHGRGAFLCTILSASFTAGITAEIDERRSPMTDTQHVVVMTTLPADADVRAFAHALVDARLAACVNVLPPMESTYRWEGRIERDDERQLLIKTSRDRIADLWNRVRELHPYDVPEFLVLPIVEGSESYLRWLGESSRPLAR
jgi:periplasmic divalent cation tolerance protein